MRRTAGRRQRPPRERDLVLIAFDDPFLRGLLAEECRDHGADVVATTPEAAAPAVRRHRPDAVVIVLSALEPDPCVFLRSILDEQRSVPVVVIGDRNEPQEEQCRSLGAREYLVHCETDPPAVWAAIAGYLPLQRRPSVIY